MADIELIQDPPRHFVGIRRDVPVTELAGFYGEVLPKVMQWVTGKGIAPASAPMTVWCKMDMETKVADAHAGVFVGAAVETEGEITAGTTAGGEVLKLVHVGGYDSMGQSWGRVYARAKELGKTPGAGWEIYVDDPGVVDHAVMKTEIYLPVS
ncbi:MAG: GyrI-like domain-containing protein [Myxococcota bacterium]